MIVGMKTSLGCTALVLSVALASCGSPPTRPVVLLDGYGGYHRDVSTDGLAAADAQVWFDQGLQLVYGFNHDEALVSFRRAAELDPTCIMALWGIAYGTGIDVNNQQVTDAEAREGYEAAQRALALLDDATPIERALVEAVATRAVYPLPEDREPLDRAYADAMADVWARFGNDADVGTLYAESLMNLQPWDYWTAEGEPLERALEIVDVLEATLALDPDHPGANHFYIHAVEASPDPARGLPSADRLRTLVPGSGHLVHMPSHIYINTGDYQLAAESNVDAIAADEAYFDVVGPPGFYSLYFVHNIHFLVFASMMEARYEPALEAVRKMEASVPPHFVEGYPERADGMLSAVFAVLIRFGRWDDVLAEPEYPEFRLASRTMRHYARAIALANLDRTDDARDELAAFDALAAELDDEWYVGINTAPVVFGIARDVALGEILWNEGDAPAAYEALERALAAEDELVYDEPPGWMLPVRHAYGALLLAGGRASQAEAVYRTDLEEWPRNAWSLIGLRNALEAQGRMAEAAAMSDEVDAAWARADVAPEVSCYCALDA